MTLAADPFRALGLPADPELTDDDVRATWRRIAAATHPDRGDGGDPAAFAAAAAAYSDLRTPFGRGEALADLAAATPPGGGAAGRRRLARSRRRARRHGPGDRGAVPEQRAGVAAGWAGRVRQGRPARLALRVLAAAAVCILAVVTDGWQPASSALIVGALTWVARSGRHDLATRPASAGWTAPARD